MVDRQRKILLQLALAEGALTSEKLAEQMGVSSRTVKSDMTVIAETLRQNGAELVSRRNRGYSLQVVDGEAFHSLFTQVSMKVNRASSRSDGERMLYIARKMAASDGGVLVDELAQELYLSRGGLRGPLREATRFLESYRLQTTSVPGQGILVSGEEHLRRMAGTELFEIHFHTVELDRADENYAKWVECDFQERQDIRHTFLQVLRESPFAVRDTQAQRIALFLIISRNRRRMGYMLSLPARWIRELRTTPVYRTAQDIYGALAERYEGFQVEEDEVGMLAIFIAIGQVPNLEREVEAMPYLAPVVQKAAEAIIKSVQQATGTDLEGIPGARALLEQEIQCVAVKARYGLDGYRTINDPQENIYMQMPVELSYARIIGGELGRLLQCRVTGEDLAEFCCYMNMLLWRTEYPIRPLRLLMTTMPGGTAYGKMAAQALIRRWPAFIRDVVTCELYEVRGRKAEDCDAILLGCTQDEMGAFGYYNYDLPAAPLVMTRQERHFERVYDTILINAFQFDLLMPGEEAMEVREDFRCYDAEQAFQFLAARYGRDPACEARLLSLFRSQEKIYTMAQQGVAVVQAEPSLCKAERLDLYQLSKPRLWEGRKIGWILFSSLSGQDLRRVKALAVMMGALVRDAGKVKEFARAPRETFRQLLRESVQTA